MKYFDVLKPNGRIVNFGASSGDKIELPLRALFYNQIDIMGTSMGSREEFNEMIKFIEKHQIKPIIDKSLLVRRSNSSTKPYGTWRTIWKYCTSNELKI